MKNYTEEQVYELIAIQERKMGMLSQAYAAINGIKEITCNPQFDKELRLELSNVLDKIEKIKNELLSETTVYGLMKSI